MRRCPQTVHVKAVKTVNPRYVYFPTISLKCGRKKEHKEEDEGSTALPAGEDPGGHQVSAARSPPAGLSAEEGAACGCGSLRSGGRSL